MDDFCRRLTLEMPFEASLGVIADALDGAGFDVIAIDVSDELSPAMNHDCPHCLLLIISPAQKRLDGMQDGPAGDTILPATVALHEAPGGATAVVAGEAFQPVSSNHALDDGCPEPLAIATIESERLARVLDELSHHAARNGRPRTVHDPRQRGG